MTEISPEKQPNIEQNPLPRGQEAQEFLDAHEAQAQEAQNRRFFPAQPNSANAEKVAEALKLQPKESAAKSTEHEESSLPQEEWELIEKDPIVWITNVLKGKNKNLTPEQQNEGMIAAMERAKTSETIH